ncbi:MAG: BrnA antitoxin family protein [Acidobacteriaceae bacterium]|nr:BrnA antitoxin family protein [Acidobacteriaceae bacterium]
MPTNSRKRPAHGTPREKRKGIKISQRTWELYEQRDKRLDNDPDARPLPPDVWAHAMRRDEFFRPIKKQTTVRIDADVLAWLKSKGDGHLTRINEILREAMLAEMKQ